MIFSCKKEKFEVFQGTSDLSKDHPIIGTSGKNKKTGNYQETKAFEPFALEIRTSGKSFITCNTGEGIFLDRMIYIGDEKVAI